jgi:coproporphyrinogen III oxidase-like Fe-S oxidoreductase
MMLAEPLLRRHMRRVASTSMRLSCGQDAPPRGGDRARVLYAHVPFCRRLCSFCAFYRVLMDEPLAARYYAALGREMLVYRDLGYSFSALYVGGGTPTVKVDELASLIALSRQLWPVRQVSVETEPGHLTREILATLAGAGVDRLSVGVQTFDPGLLERIGRGRDQGTGVGSRLAEACALFPTVNVDMIYGLPGETPAALARDLAAILEVRPQQVTFYPLMGGGEPAVRGQARSYRQIVNALRELYRPATPWCFSLRGREQGSPLPDEYLAEADEYAGIGAGSFGYVDGTLYANVFSVERYVDALEEGRLAVAGARRLKAAEQLRYSMLVGLARGELALDDLRRLCGSLRGLRREILLGLVTGLLALRRGRVALTARGAYAWTVLMQEFFTALNRLRDRLRAAEPMPAASATCRRGRAG